MDGRRGSDRDRRGLGEERAVVFSQFDRAISSFPLGGGELADERSAPLVVKKTALSPLPAPLAPEYVLGRILFHASSDQMARPPTRRVAATSG